MMARKAYGAIHSSADKEIGRWYPRLRSSTARLYGYAETRDDAVRLACEAITEILSRSEIVQLDVPQLPKASLHEGIPWE